MRNTLLVAALLAVAGSASAQYTAGKIDTNVSNANIRLGWVIPVDSSMRDIGTNFAGVGIDVLLPRSFFSGAQMYVSADYIQRWNRGEDSLIPIALNAKFWDKNGIEGERTYGFVGAGVAFTNLGRSSAVALIRGGFGRELNRQLFVEAALTLTDKNKGGVRSHNVGLYLGYKF